MMTMAAVILGGNGDRAQQVLARAEALLADGAGRIAARSSLWRTEAWGFDGPDFLNRVLVLETDLEPEALLDRLQAVENALGRDRRDEARRKALTGNRYAERPIDIDLLLYGDSTICTPRLTVPHPLLHERAFVLEPLCEVLPAAVHPQTGDTISQMAAYIRQKGGPAVEKVTKNEQKR